MQFGISVSCPRSRGLLPEEIRTKKSGRPSGVSKGGHLVGTGSSCWSRSHGSQASLFFSSNSESCSPFLQLFTIPICSSLVDIGDICHGLKSRASLFKTFSPPLSREGHYLSFVFTVPGNSDKNPSPLFSSQCCVHCFHTTVFDVQLFHSHSLVLGCKSISLPQSHWLSEVCLLCPCVFSMMFLSSS